MESPVKLTLDGVKILIARAADGNVYAFENNCPHQDKPLDSGQWDAACAEIRCPFHGAVFQVGAGGKVRIGPSPVPLAMLPTELRMDGGVEVIYVGLEED